MNQSETSVKRRVVVLVAVLMLHFLVGVLVIRASRFQVVIKPQEFAALIFLPSPKPEASRPVISSGVRPLLSSPEKSRTTSRAPAPVLDTEKNNAITMPNVDWGAQAQEAVRNGEFTRLEKGNRNLVPVPGAQHKAGRSERSEGGEVITWEDDECFWTTRGINPNGMPETKKICKDPFKPDVQMFKDMRKKLDEDFVSQGP
jgi:hypothetical protein